MNLLSKNVLIALVALPLGLSSTLVRADHPPVNEMGKVIDTAHLLQEDSHELHEEAEAANHHGGWGVRQALQNLHTLQEKAADFHNTAERYRSEPRHTERHFRNLVRTYQEARRTFRSLHTNHEVQDLYDRVNRTMRSLQYFYRDGQGNGGGGHWDRPRAKRLAHEIGDKMEHAYNAARKELDDGHHGGKKRMRRAVSALKQAMRNAHHLHHNIEDGGTTANHTRRDFDRLRITFSYAERAVRRARFDGHVKRDVRDAGTKMRSLSRLYYQRNGGGHGWGHDR